MTRVNNTGQSYGNYQPDNAEGVQGTPPAEGGPDTSNSQGRAVRVGAGGPGGLQSIDPPDTLKTNNFNALLDLDKGPRIVDDYLDVLEFAHKVDQSRQDTNNKLVAKTRTSILQDAKDISSDQKKAGWQGFVFAVAKTGVEAGFKYKAIKTSSTKVPELDNKPNSVKAQSEAGIGDGIGGIIGAGAKWNDNVHEARQTILRSHQSFNQSILEDYRDALRKARDDGDAMIAKGGDVATDFIKSTSIV